MADIGDKIRVDWMKDEPDYCGRTGVVKYIDDIGQLHGTWGGLAIIPDEDLFSVLEEGDNSKAARLYQILIDNGLAADDADTVAEAIWDLFKNAPYPTIY